MTNDPFALTALNVAEKISDLIEKAPAGGIFHEGALSPVCSIRVAGLAEVAGFSIEFTDAISSQVFDVAIQRSRN